MNGNIGIDISYSLSRDANVIDWLSFLKKRNKTDLECVAARVLSTKWQTNPVADVSVYLPRHVKSKMATGTPLDYVMQVYSKKFSQAIWKKDWRSAKLIYLMIQNRGLQLTMEFLEL